MSDSTWYPRDREAESLAAQLRTNRLTLLFGAAASGKTTLLTAGVIPLLHRRVTDEPGEAGVAGVADGGVVLPFPERRMADDGSLIDAASPASAESAARAADGAGDKPAPLLGNDGEIVVFFDAWDEAPLEGLLTRMREALSFPSFDGAKRRRSLASTLGAFHRQRGGRSLIVLDRFEEFLVQPEYAPGARQFTDAFVDAMNRPGLPVHFLVSLNEDAAPLLERFRGRVAGLDDHCLRLPPLQRPGHVPGAIPVLRQVPEGYRPPIDLELPSRSAPPSIQPVDPAQSTSPGALNSGPMPLPAEYATSRQPEWMESAFAAPAAESQMNTKDVYASMEALLGRIVEGTKEAEQRVMMQSAAAAAAAAPPPSLVPPAAPLQPSSAKAHAAGTEHEKPVAEAAPASAPAAMPQARSAAAHPGPTQVWPPSTVARHGEAAPEFAPIFTYESGGEGRAMAREGGDVDHVVESRPPEPEALVTHDPGPTSEPDATPNSDWLSEVHASLTKLANQPPESQGMIGSHTTGVAAPRQTSNNNSPARIAAIAAVFLLVIVLLVVGSAFLPPEYRPFDLPPSVMSFFDGGAPVVRSPNP